MPELPRHGPNPKAPDDSANAPRDTAPPRPPAAPVTADHATPPVTEARPVVAPKPGHIARESMRRLHPATIAIEFVRRLWNMAYYIAIAVFLRLAGEESDEPRWVDYVIIGLTLIGVIGAVLRYISFRYAVVGEHLIVRSGILARQHRTIPIAKIQNIDFQRTILHRALGVVDIKIETAGGAKPEGDLSALSVPAADDLKADLLRRRAAAHARSADEPDDAATPSTTAAAESSETPERVLWAATPRDLLLAGATENRIGVIFAGIAGLYYTFQQVLFRHLQPLLDTVSDALGAASTFTIALLVIALGIVLVGIGWLLSIVLTYAQFYDFKLTEEDRRLRRKHGLFTQVESVVPLRRVQMLRLVAPPLRRLIRRKTILADTASSIAAQGETSGGTPICPLLHQNTTDSFCRHVFADLAYDELNWRQVSPRTIQRFAVRLILVGGIAVGALAYAWDVRALWALPALLGAAIYLGWLRYRGLGYAEQGDYVATRAGVLTRREWIVPVGKVQAVYVNANPFQRRLGLANLEIHTAGATFTSGAAVPDLPLDEAIRLQEKLSRAAHAAGPWLLDGV